MHVYGQLKLQIFCKMQFPASLFNVVVFSMHSYGQCSLQCLEHVILVLWPLGATVPVFNIVHFVVQQHNVVLPLC